MMRMVYQIQDEQIQSISNSSDASSHSVSIITRQEDPSLSSTMTETTTRIYGHLHYAKTAGTTINGVLAAKYERVCGHKGYSYDAYQFNKRVSDQINQAQTRKSGDNRTSNPVQVQMVGRGDLIQRHYKGYNRGRIPMGIMGEIGFENCDYISLEDDWKEWLPFLTDDKPWDVLELHVPCRDPLPHITSQCNFRRQTFDCDAKDLKKSIKKCLVKSNRFSNKLHQYHKEGMAMLAQRNNSPNNTTGTGVQTTGTRKSSNTTTRLEMKCFDSRLVQHYLEYMGQILQPKRFPARYIHRESNPPHNKSKECLLDSKNQVMAHKVEQFLLKKLPYYQWCQQCMSDPNRNLFFGTK